MSTDLATIGSALYSKIANNGTVTTWYGAAPGSQNPPFAVLSLQDGTDQYMFGSTVEIHRNYMLKVFTDDDFPIRAENLYEGLHSLLQDSLGSISGYDVLRVRRVTPISFRDPDGFWNVGGIYAVEVVR